MAIIETINDEYHFWHWLQNSESYKNNFSLEGAKAVFNYLEELSEESTNPIEFDPIAWCIEFTEYDSVNDCVNEVFSSEADMNLETLEDNTIVLKDLDNGHVVIQDF